MIDLTGKHIVVTGASAGIGLELARQLGARGCRLTLAARRGELLEQATAEVQQAGGRAHPVRCDVTERQQVFALAQQARRAFGEIDIWVSNAGAGIRHGVLDATEEDMLYMFRLNCLSSLWAYQAVAPRWIKLKCGGQLVDICSVMGKTGVAFHTGYGVAKHGLSGLGDTARQELMRHGIWVTTVYPGVTVSDFPQASLDRFVEGDRPTDRDPSRHRNFLVRKVSQAQPTELVVQQIVQAMERPVPTVYPHRWANFAALLANLWPGLVLSQLTRAAKT